MKTKYFVDKLKMALLNKVLQNRNFQYGAEGFKIIKGGLKVIVPPLFMKPLI